MMKTMYESDFDAIQKDAARYRWLRDNNQLVNVQLARLCGTGIPSDMDDAVDAAMRLREKMEGTDENA